MFSTTKVPRRKIDGTHSSSHESVLLTSGGNTTGDFFLIPLIRLRKSGAGGSAEVFFGGATEVFSARTTAILGLVAFVELRPVGSALFFSPVGSDLLASRLSGLLDGPESQLLMSHILGKSQTRELGCHGVVQDQDNSKTARKKRTQ